MLKQCDCKGWKQFVPLHGTDCRWCGRKLAVEETEKMERDKNFQEIVGLIEECGSNLREVEQSLSNLVKKLKK